MTRSHRSIWTFAANGVQTVGMMCASLVATPLFLRWLGQDKYGAYLFALQCMGYLALLELGLGTAVMPLFIRHAGQPADLAKAMRVAFRSWRLVATNTLIGTVLIAILVPLYIKGSAAVRADLQMGLLLGILPALLTLLVPARLLLEASQRGYLVAGAIFAQNLSITILGLASAWILHHFGWGWQITGLFGAIGAGSLIFQTIIIRHVRKCFPGVLRELLAMHGDPQTRQELGTRSKSALVLHASNQVGLFTDLIVIGCLLGPALVVPFSITQRLIGICQGQLKSVGDSVWASLGELHARGQREKFNQRLLELTRLIVVLGTAAMVPLAAYNHYFVTLWVGRTNFGGECLTVLACLNAVLFGIILFWENTFNATGHLAARVPVALTSAGVNLTASIACTILFGLPGPVLGTTIAMILVSLWWYPLLLAKIFGIAPRALAVAMGKPLLLGLPFGMGIWQLAHSHNPAGWLGLGAEMALAGMLFLSLAWMLVFNAADQQLWRERVGMMLRRRTAALPVAYSSFIHSAAIFAAPIACSSAEVFAFKQPKAGDAAVIQGSRLAPDSGGPWNGLLCTSVNNTWHPVANLSRRRSGGVARLTQAWRRGNIKVARPGPATRHLTAILSGRQPATLLIRT